MSDYKLANIYSQPLMSIAADAAMADAAQLMARHRIRHLPVLQDGKIMGIISDRDVQRAAHVAVYRWEDLRIQNQDFNPDDQVQDFMSYPVLKVDVGSSLGDAAQRMIEKGVSSLLVVENDQVVGIITTEDMLRIIVEHFPRNSTHPKALGVRAALGLMSAPLGFFIGEMSSSGI